MKRFLFILLSTVMLFSGTINAYAMSYPSTLPALPEQTEDFYHVIYKSGNTTVLGIAKSDDGNHENIKVKLQMETNGYYQYIVENTSDFSVFIYTLDDDNTWHHEVTRYGDAKTVQYIGGGNTNDKAMSIVYSNIDILDKETGKVVFPLPLAEQIRGVAEETLTVETMPELNKTVLVVVLCGVGCLALVTSLVLLRKVLPIFLN